jgi:hypothetical protein
MCSWHHFPLQGTQQDQGGDELVQRFFGSGSEAVECTGTREKGRTKGGKIRGINILPYYNLRMRNEKIQSYSCTG